MAYTVTVDPFSITICEDDCGPHPSFPASRTAAIELLEEIVAAAKADLLTIKRAPTFGDYLDRVAASRKPAVGAHE